MSEEPDRPESVADEAEAADRMAEADFADEHSGATYADQMRGGPEGEPEPETPRGYAGMESRGPDGERIDEPPD